MTPQRKLQNARSHVVQSHPFFGTLLLKQRLVETDRCATMATDGDHLYFNPEFVEAKTMTELHAVCAHEALHPGLLHHVRRGDRDPALWNIACDFAINLILDEAKFKLPPEGLLDERFRGMNAEQIYAKLRDESYPIPAQPRPDGSSGDDGEGEGSGGGEYEMPSYGGMGSVLDAPAKDATDLQAQESKWKVAAAQAAMAAAGRVGAQLKAALGEALEPRVDWREQLWRFAQQFSKDDSSWRRPNRRFVADGLYLPSMHSEKIGPALFVTDSSGSMSDLALRQALGEVEAIVERVRPERLDVVVHDVEVNSTQSFEPGEEVKVEVVGRGGTAFRPTCEWIRAQPDDYAFVIWFTDLYPYDWDAAAEVGVDAPLIWIDYGDSRIEPAFGDEVIRMPETLEEAA